MSKQDKFIISQIGLNIFPKRSSELIDLLQKWGGGGHAHYESTNDRQILYKTLADPGGAASAIPLQILSL